MNNKQQDASNNVKDAKVEVSKPYTVTLFEQFKKNAILEQQTISFIPEEFTKIVGSILNRSDKTYNKIVERKNKFYFKIVDGSASGLIVSIPNETANSDNLTRVIKTFVSVSHQMFAGLSLEEETKNETHIKILQSFESVGIKFSSLCKASVNAGLKSWANNKRLKVAAITEKTNRANLRLNAENEVMRSELSTSVAVSKESKKLMLPELKKQLSNFMN